MPHKNKDIARNYRKIWKQNRRKEDKEYATIQNRKWRDSNPKGYLLSRARARSRSENLPFNLSVNDLQMPEYCPIFGLKLEFSNGRNTRPDNIPTLDRTIPSLGYVKGNVSIISMKANRLKSNASLKELKQIVAWLETKILQMEDISIILKEIDLVDGSTELLDDEACATGACPIR